MTFDRAAALKPGLVLAGFRLVEQLGSDGLGELFRAQNVHAPRLLRAIRVIRAELAAQPDFRTQLLGVAELLDVLDHPNLLRLHHLGEEGDFLFTVHDLLIGRTLRALTSEQRAHRPVGVVADWIYQALCGLGHAHHHGIIHQVWFPPSAEPGGRSSGGAGRRGDSGKNWPGHVSWRPEPRPRAEFWLMSDSNLPLATGLPPWRQRTLSVWSKRYR